MQIYLFESLFHETITRYTADANVPTELWHKVQGCYSQSGRHYHTLVHLDHFAKVLLPFRQHISTWDIMILAIAYHDIVYNPLQSDNEERSAAVAANELSNICVDEISINRCRHYILSTKLHEASDHETNLFIDADLSILGSDSTSYDLYAKNVRKEYRIYPDVIYRPGRKKVLNHFLQMPSIFKTPHFRDLYENQARANLLRELQSY